MEENNRKRSLVVDDHPVFGRGFERAVSEGGFDVDYVTNGKDADALVAKALANENPYDCLVTDVALEEESGLDLAMRLKRIRPEMAVVVQTLLPLEFLVKHPQIAAIANETFCKTAPIPVVLAKIEHAIWIKHNLGLVEQSMGKIGAICGDAVRLLGSIKDCIDATRLDVQYKDGKLSAFTTWRNLDDPTRINISPSPTIGCKRMCVFCGVKERGFERVASMQEVLGQFHLGMRTYLARPAIDGAQRICFHVSGSGEWGDNVDNVCEAMEIAHHNVKFPLSFVVTTIGLEASLLHYQRNWKQLHKLVQLYWSLHFTDDETRWHYMPGVRGESIYRIRDLLCEFSDISKKPNVLGYSIIKGRNNSDSDVRALANLMKTWWSRLPPIAKFMPMDTSCMEGVEPTTEQDVQNFAERFSQTGMPFCVRSQIGEYGMICGSTLPDWLEARF